MKAFIVIALLCLGGAQASLLDDLAAAATAALDGILTTAQTAAQELLDTYVPVLGQAAQQLVGEAVSNLGDSLTGLVSGKRKRQEFQTEIGQIINDGVQALLEHTTTAIQNVQQALTGTIDSLFGSPDPVQALATTKRALKKNSLKAKSQIGLTNRKMKTMVAKKVSRDFFSDLANGVATIFQPVIDQASLAFNQLVDAATAVGAQVVDHGTALINNLTTTVQDTVNSLSGVIDPYVQDAQTIIGSVTDHFTNTFGADTTA
ncbi:uncharacterized protein [Branchiostoma lanceolatum]|uniref:uncharacterized protein n=1 Tax=Branchiostoma lanceolatum TaxID=7740 RepID=UPI003454717E